MPRTVEGIVEAHRRARDLRSQGKPAWTYNVKLKDLFGNDKSDEQTVIIASEVAKRLRVALPNEMLDLCSDDSNEDIIGIIEEFEDFKTTTFNGDACERFNDLMDALYDWADSARLWIG